MRPFQYQAARSCEEAIGTRGSDGVFYAGGTDLVPLMQQDIIAPTKLVDIKRCGLQRGMEECDGHLRVGALTTLADLERDPLITSHYPILAQAAAVAATPQLRHRATLAGNLLQRPRCWYFRHRDIACWLKGGSGCPAVEGQNQHLAILEPRSPCHAVHPSDMAPVLLALDARVNLRGRDSHRTLAMDEFFAEPEETRQHETRIEPDELIQSIDLPELPAGSNGIFLKCMERKVWAFALVSVAVVRTPDSWRVALGGVAATPRLLPEIAARLQAAQDCQSRLLAAASALDDARPLSMNGYKVQLAQQLLFRAVEHLGDSEP